MEQPPIYVLREFNQHLSTTQALEELDYPAQTLVLDQKIIDSNNWISQQLDVPLATKVFYLRRLRIVKGIPRSIEKIFIDHNRVEGIEEVDLNNVSFYRILHEKFAFNVIKKKEEILIVEANSEEANLLKIPENSQIAFFKGTTFIDENKPFEYFEDSAIPSFYRYRSEWKL